MGHRDPEETNQSPDPSEPEGDTAAAQQVTPPAQASSLMLLQTILDSALDVGYKENAETGEGPLAWWRIALITLLVLLLGFGTGIAIRALRVQEGSADAARISLLTQVEEKQDYAASLKEEVQSLSARAEEQRNVTSPLVQLPLSVHIASGDVPISGPGISIEVADGDSLVRDSDIRTIINLLWQSGAEAIAIDDVRLGPTTTIRTAGSAILVDFQAVSGPYLIEAIGNQQTMLNALQLGGQNSGGSETIVKANLKLTVSPEEELDLESATGTRLKHSEAAK